MDSKLDLILSRRQMLAMSASSLAAMGLAGCGGTSDVPAEDSADTADDASTTDDTTTSEVAELTVEPGKLTVATGEPAWEPWVMDDDPESGEGFEAALIYALAEQMGFAADDVIWTRTTFDEAYAPGDHDWDLDIQQVSINEDRQQAVDFSPAYFRPTQAVIVKADGDYADATSVSDLADATIAVMVGTTAYDYVKDIIKGGSEEGIDIFNDNSAAAAAVTAGQADALVTDTPQAVYMVESEQVENGLVVGQIPGTEDEYGLGITLAKDSPLTPYVEEAMNAILADGTVDSLISEWLAAYTTDIPTLSE